MKKLIVLSFLAVACAVSLANIEVDASDDTVINQYLLLKNQYNITKSRYMLCETHSNAVKLNKAEKDYEEGRTHTEEEIWGMFSKKYGFTYKILS